MAAPTNDHGGISMWIPLLTGPAATCALNVSRKVADRLLIAEAEGTAMTDSVPTSDKLSDALRRPWLDNGALGAAVLLDAIGADLSDSTYRAASRRLLVRSAQAINEAPDLGLFRGVAGLGWVIAQLQARGVLDFGAEAELQLTLRELLQAAPPTAFHVDLASGLAGIGIFVLECRPSDEGNDLLRLLLALIQARGVGCDSGIDWAVTAGGPIEGEWFSPGMAHGSAGVVAFLSSLVMSGRIGAEANALLASAAQRLLMQTARPRPHGLRPDLTWCWGETGSAAATVLAGYALEDEHKVSHGRARLLDCVEAMAVVPLYNCSSLCCGAAGFGHTLNRLGQLLRDSELMEAARQCFQRLVALYDWSDDVSGGFKYVVRVQNGVAQFAAGAGLTRGLAGVALALIAASTTAEPAWDRVMGLSCASTVR